MPDACAGSSRFVDRLQSVTRASRLGSRFWQTLRLGLKSLLLHKLRSGLAILGIFIGVTAVIWLVAMGEGVSYQAQQQIKDLGANNIIVRSIKPPSDATRGGGFIIAYGLLRDDYDRIVGQRAHAAAGGADARNPQGGPLSRQGRPTCGWSAARRSIWR